MYSGHRHHQHHHHPYHHQQQQQQQKPAVSSPDSAAAADVFEQLCAASTFKSVLHHYRHLCDILRIKPTNIRNFYPKLKAKLRSWKAQALWNKFDKRASHKCYNHGKACTDSKVLIIGAGPCGLRSAIEAQLLGAKVVVIEKRDRFSRNNVLHLWPFVISDLKQLGAKKFYGKFCAGAIDHISIRQIQCILLKVALMLGVEVFESVGFEELVEPPIDQSEKIGWRARLSPADHPANQYEFNTLLGADGKRNTLAGFRRKEFRGKLAIAITANFINKRSEAEASVQEISGVAFIFNQKFFKELYAATGIDLENIVYYKDETHYFVMTAKKHSLIDKGVILNDLPDTQQLLHPSNVDREALLEYAREAADFSTSYQLPHLDFAVNHYGKPDVAMFDFTSMFAAENACRMLERHDHKLLMGLVGDTLLEPFWPTGSGCARGFLGCLDAAWMVRSYYMGRATPLEVLAERESIYRLLAQTTPENLNKDHLSYTLDPASRYPTINLRAVLPFQVRNLFDTDTPQQETPDSQTTTTTNDDLPKKRKRRDSLIHPDTLLLWCKKQVALYSTVHLVDMTTSFKDGRALCAIIHRYRPDLIDFEGLSPAAAAANNQLAFDTLEREFGIPPVMTGAEMSDCEVPDKLSMISYLSQIYDVFRGEIPHLKYPKMDASELEMGKTGRPARITTKKMEVEEENEEAIDEEGGEEEVEVLKNLTNTSQPAPPARKRRDDGRMTCRVMEEGMVMGGGVRGETGDWGERGGDPLKRNKKRRSDRVLSPEERGTSEERVERRAGALEPSGDFSDKVKGLEAKFTSISGVSGHVNKPKDLVRAIGKIEKSDWNLAAIERKMHANKFGTETQMSREKVPKWSRDAYDDKFHNIERRLRENGEDEETIAKYRDIDSSLKRLEMKLREGSTLDTGLRGQNKVSNLASQLSSKLVKNSEPEKVLVPRQPSRPMVPLPSSGSDLCHFCHSRVYLVERLSAEGKFFHRQCFKCDYCAANLRLGNYIYDREGRYGGKFFCIPHFGLTPKTRGVGGVGTRQRREDSAKENIVPPQPTPATPPTLQVRHSSHHHHYHHHEAPRTWPFLPMVSRDDGELSHRQYTSLLRRASLRCYTPAHNDPLLEGKPVNDLKDNWKHINGTTNNLSTRSNNSKQSKQIKVKDKETENQSMKKTGMSKSLHPASEKSNSAITASPVDAVDKVNSSGVVDVSVTKTSRIPKPLKALCHLKNNRKLGQPKHDPGKQKDKLSHQSITGTDQTKRVNKVNNKHKEQKHKVDSQNNKIKIQKTKIDNETKQMNQQNKGMIEVKKRASMNNDSRCGDNETKKMNEENRSALDVTKRWSMNEDHRGQHRSHRSQLYIKLSAGSHLSESVDTRIIRSNSLLKHHNTNHFISDLQQTSKLNHISNLISPSESQVKVRQLTNMSQEHSILLHNHAAEKDAKCSIENKHQSNSSKSKNLVPRDSQTFDFATTPRTTQSEILGSQLILHALSSSSPASPIVSSSFPPPSRLPSSLPSSPFVPSPYIPFSVPGLSLPLTTSVTTCQPPSFFPDSVSSSSVVAPSVTSPIPSSTFHPVPASVRTPSLTMPLVSHTIPSTSALTVPSLLSSSSLTAPPPSSCLVPTPDSSNPPPVPPPRGKARVGESKEDKCSAPHLSSLLHSTPECDREREKSVLKLPPVPSQQSVPSPGSSVASSSTVQLSVISSSPPSNTPHISASLSPSPVKYTQSASSKSASVINSVISDSCIPSTPPPPCSVTVTSSTPPPSLTSSTSSTSTTSSVWSRYLSWLHRVTKT